MDSKKSLLIVLAVATSALATSFGCGSDAPSKSEEEAFKKHDKNAIAGPPPGANNAPANFHSSLGTAPGAPGAPPAATGK